MTKVGIVVSEFNKEITDRLLTGAEHALESFETVGYDVVRVSGAWEIPAVLNVMTHKRNYDAMVAIGCVIRGETPHFDNLCQQTASALMKISIDNQIPVGFGILGVETYQQALARSDPDDPTTNRGVEAIMGALSAHRAMCPFLYG